MRYRFRYCKRGKVRFVSHRDGARLWERALRRVALPVAYTEGFTPRPKLSFGLALPTGAESVAEYIDIDLATDVDADDGRLVDGLSSALPHGMEVLVAAECGARRVSLQDEVSSTTWQLTAPGLSPDVVGEAARRLLDADELLVERERKGRSRVDDIRPVIRDLRPDGSGTGLVAELATVGRALRPAELAAAAFPDIDPVEVRVLRTHQWIDHDGEQREVLALPAGVSALDMGLSA